MKQSLILIATMIVAPSAAAQSSVTLFGLLDVSISRYSNRSEERSVATSANPFYLNRGGVKVSRTALATGGYSGSRIGFRGTEDLGGGLAASFWLEAPVANDTGGTGISSFARRSTVSFSGGFGEFRVGRDYVPTFWIDSLFDSFGANGVGASLIFVANNIDIAGGAGGFAGNPTSVRVSNSVGYFLPPSLAGFYGQALYGLHENIKYEPGTSTPTAANNSRTGRYLGGRFGYANGPLDVAVAYGNSTTGDSFFAGTTDFVKTVTAGASYDFGPLKMFGQLSRVKSSRDFDGNAILPTAIVPDIDLTGHAVGATVPIGPGEIRAAYSHVKYDYNVATRLDAKAVKIALGYVHNLSKRTLLYVSVARISSRNGAPLTVGGPAFISNATFAPTKSTGYDFGLRHAF